MAARFYNHDPSFQHLLGPAAIIECLVEKDYAFAHEAGVFLPDKNVLFITSNRLDAADGSPRVQISRITLGETADSTTCDEVLCDGIVMANGGVNYGEDVIFCAQGSPCDPSGLYQTSTSSPFKTQRLVADFYGRPFNSFNDVVVHSDGSIWFTDPAYGYEQGYRPRPSLPSQVYRFQPRDGSIRAIADGFGHPNGICFSPDEATVYITDTDRQCGDGTVDDSKVSSFYAFDMDMRTGEPFLTNRRLFAMCDVGIPDGIKCDMEGNVYSGCGDGVNVWCKGGRLLGRILVDGGVANFCFGRPGEMFLLNEKRLWRVRLCDGVRGALLKL